MKKTYKAVLPRLHDIMTDIDRFSKAHGIAGKWQYRLRLVAEELIVNIIHYAYPDTEGNVYMELGMQDNTMVKMVIINTGIKFNPLESAAPDISAPIDRRQPGGLGIMMAQTLASRINYQFRDKKNIITVFMEIAPDE